MRRAVPADSGTFWVLGPLCTCCSLKQVFRLEVKLYELLALLVRPFWPQLLPQRRISPAGKAPMSAGGTAMVRPMTAPSWAAVVVLLPLVWLPSPGKGAAPRVMHRPCCQRAGRWALLVAACLQGQLSPHGVCSPRRGCGLAPHSGHRIPYCSRVHPLLLSWELR